ncbi:MAG TPA: sugar kinase [Streptosporangiaceae bacterium]|nr:sugar kinase [Streptosporangiaceae bacterium]
MTRTSASGDAPELVAFGEALIAFVASPAGPLHEAKHFTPHVAGAESNVAIGVARLGHRVGFAGRVGDDAFGSMIVRRLLAEGVAIDHLVRDSGAPTGLLFRNLREFPPPEIAYRRQGSAGSCLTPDDVRAALEGLPPGTVVHVSGVTPALSESCRAAVLVLAEAAHVRELRLFVDVNYRARLWSTDVAAPVLRNLVASASIVTASRPEAALLTGKDNPVDAAAALMNLGPRVAVIRDDALGAVASTSPHEAPIVVPGHAAGRAVDAVGAGDAFNAGLIASLLENRSLPDAIARAHLCGAAAVGVVGDIEGLPTRLELTSSADDVRR